MKYKDLTKGQAIKSKQLGIEVSGRLEESVKQGRGVKGTVLIHTNASEVGMFDEIGSVYATDITQAMNKDDHWEVVEHEPKMLEWAKERDKMRENRAYPRGTYKECI